MNAILEREEIRIPDTPEELLVDETRRSLEARAKEVLDYKLNPEAITIEKLRNKRTQLAKALAQLEIRPFTSASVIAYKENELERRQHIPKDKLLTIATNIMGVGAIAGCLLLLACVLVIGIGKSMESVNNSFAIAGLLTLLACGISFNYFWDKRQLVRGRQSSWSWQWAEISGYRRPIPDHALRIAIAVKEACPWARIEIEELVNVGRTADPFLVAEITESSRDDLRERYYLAVWDEPRFDAEIR